MFQSDNLSAEQVEYGFMGLVPLRRMVVAFA